MRDLKGRLDLCSINTATLGHREAIGPVIDAVARAGFGGIAPWLRDIPQGTGALVARHLRDAGLVVSGLCRSPYIPAADRAGFAANIEANRRAIDLAATLSAACFVMVVGSLPHGSRDVEGARAQVREGTAILLEHARQCGVALALEPLHPVYAADRSCLTTLGEALDWCDAIDDPGLGVAIDAYHVWWDPALAMQIERAGGASRILAFHVCDWLVPTRDMLTDRGMMGDGVIDLPRLRRMVEGAGYDGAVEVEIFSSLDWWRRPAQETLDVCARRLQTVC